VARTDTPRIAVLGAGPIGLEAALYAKSLNLLVTVYERGQVGEHVQRWGHVRLFSPFGMNVTPLGRAAILTEQPRHNFPGDNDCVTGREHLQSYLLPLSQTQRLRDCVKTGTAVLRVARRGFLKEDVGDTAARARQPFLLLARDAKNNEWIDEADVVLDCTGTYAQHRWLGEGGIPALGERAAQQHIAYGLEDIAGEKRLHYAGKYVLVVGSGYSAATTVCALDDLAVKSPETWVIWLARGPRTQPLKRLPNDPLKERDRLAQRANNLATRTEGNVEFHSQSAVEAVESHQGGFRVRARLAGSKRTFEVERLIANVGYRPDTDLFGELQVHLCYASEGPMKLAAALAGQRGEDCLQQTSQGADVLRNPEPNFFVLGAKSYGRNTLFLLRIGFEQIREVFGLITGKPERNLYLARVR
jgi:thioredoxin reductase